MRLQFRKTGAIRYSSHLDAMRLFQKCFLASGFPVSFSLGFHPHPRMSFGPALRTGWEGLDEYLDVYLDAPADEVAARCNPFLPDGMRITGHAVIPGDAPKLPEDIVAAGFRVRVPIEGPAASEKEVRSAAREAAAGGDRGDTSGTIAIDPLKPFEAREVLGGEEREAPKNGFKPEILKLAMSQDEEAVQIDYMTTMKGGKCAAPEELALSVVRHRGSAEPVKVARTGLFIKRKGVYVSPLQQRAIS
jgi:radical SAM-linked protein